MNEKDVRIVLAPKISQAFLKNLQNGNPDVNQINLIMVAQAGDNNSVGGVREILKQEPFNFETFLESMPEPRLQNLITLAIETAIEKFRYNSRAAGWLGISIRTIYRELVGERSKIRMFKGKAEDLAMKLE